MGLLTDIEADAQCILSYVTSPESYEAHRHSKGQLTYFEGGSSHLYADNKTFFIPTNHFVWIPAQRLHQFVHLKVQDICVRTFYFPTSLYNGTYFEEIGIYHAGPLVSQVLGLPESRGYQPRDPIFDFLTSFIRLLPTISKQSINLQLPGTDHPVIKEVLSYLLAHVEEPLTLSSVSERYHLGERTFSRLFFRELGMNFFQYLKNARMMRSVELILAGQHSMTEIAYRVGYTSLAAYSNAFVSVMNKRPTDFKLQAVKSPPANK